VPPRKQRCSGIPKRWRCMTERAGKRYITKTVRTQERAPLGDDGVRAMPSSGGGIVEAASVPHQHRAALAAVSRTVHTLKEDEHAGARQAEAAQLAQGQALGHRRGPTP
jgi:hypothetical protein